VADDRDEDLDIDTEGSGFALHAEMAISEFLLRYWMVLAGVAAAGILGLLIYGQIRNMYVESQRKTTSAIADVMADLPGDLITLAQAKAGVRPGTDVDPEALAKAGDELADIARQGEGTASIEAWLKAAELYRIADQPDKRRGALEAAASAATGVLHYSAVAALANLDLEEGRIDDALDRFRSLQGEDQEFLAREATLDLASTLEALDRSGEAAAVYQEYLDRWPEAPDASDVSDRLQKAKERSE